MCIFLGEAENPYIYENNDLIEEIISSISETAGVNQTPQYAQNQYHMNGGIYNAESGRYVAGDACFPNVGNISRNGSVCVYSNDESYGIDNPDFVDDSYNVPTDNLHHFDIEYLQYPEEVLKVQVSP